MLIRLFVRPAAALGLVAGLLLAPPPPAHAYCPAGTVTTSLSSGTFGVTAVCLPAPVVSPGSSGSTGGSGFVALAVAYCVTTPNGIQAVHVGKEAEISSISDADRRVPCPESVLSPGPTPAQIQEAARSAVAAIQLPPVEPRYGPPAELNTWGLVPVGYPIWLWTPIRPDIQTVVTRDGITISILATRVGTTFAMGDGRTVSCPRSTPWTSAVEPGTASPTCGYKYQAMNTKGAGYTVTARDHWIIGWSALTESGTVTTTRTATMVLPVGELQSLVTGRG